MKSESWIGKQKNRKMKENRFRMIGEIQILTCETKAMEDEGKKLYNDQKIKQGQKLQSQCADETEQKYKNKPAAEKPTDMSLKPFHRRLHHLWQRERLWKVKTKKMVQQKEKKTVQERGNTYILSSAVGDTSDEDGHIANNIGCKSQI